jgi:hypothetical protein
MPVAPYPEDGYDPRRESPAPLRATSDTSQPAQTRHAAAASQHAVVLLHEPERGRELVDFGGGAGSGLATVLTTLLRAPSEELGEG